MAVVLRLHKICCFGWVCNTPCYQQMSVKITQWRFKQRQLTADMINGKDTTLTGSWKITPCMCVFHTHCHREGNKFLHPSEPIHFHTLCPSVSALTGHTREATTAETFEVAQLRWLNTPHCLQTDCVLSVHNLQRAAVKRSLCEVIQALTEVRLRPPRRPRASEKNCCLLSEMA